MQLTGLPIQAEPSEYSYLCADGHLQPINNTKPCVWIAKPWPVVAARRSHAAQIQKLITGLNHDVPNSWQNALLSLLETYHVQIQPLDNVIPIDDYLDQATAFQSAYSFPECNPPRSIVYCTTSIIQHIKCSWLQEAAQVYGIQPNIQCIRATDLQNCMDDTKHQTTDVVLVDHEHRLQAQRDYNLIPLLYEFSQDMHERYAIIAVVHKDAKFQSFEDLKNAKVCLPSHEGAAHLSVQSAVGNFSGDSLLALHEYFHRDSCTWQPKARRQCPAEYKGDEGALRCLAEGGHVAFISSDVYKAYTIGNLTSAWIKQSGHKSFRTLCPFGHNEQGSKFEYCYMHWTPRGHLMTHNSSVTRRNEIYNSLRDIDQMFGKNYKTETRPFTMYGIFDKRNNIMFRDNTEGLRGLQDLKKDSSKRIMENIYEQYIEHYEQLLRRENGGNGLSYKGSLVLVLCFWMTFSAWSWLGLLRV